MGPDEDHVYIAVPHLETHIQLKYSSLVKKQVVEMGYIAGLQANRAFMYSAVWPASRLFGVMLDVRVDFQVV